MEQLQYVIEDKTIAELLGIQNFSTDESAILELVKNAYDASAEFLELSFDKDTLTIIDDGTGMNMDDIKQKWMHVGKSTKEYKTILPNNKVRVLAGSKGIGRFALARLGEAATIYSKRANFPGVTWETDWNTSTVTNDDSINHIGTKIIISRLRSKWNKKKINKLIEFLSKTYNDNVMKIRITHPEVDANVEPYFAEFRPGINCWSNLIINYSSSEQILKTEVISDEFLDSAANYCTGVDLKYYCRLTDMFEELKGNPQWDFAEGELEDALSKLGDFSANLSFTMSPTKLDCDKFLYKHYLLPVSPMAGVVLYRNAFSISSYEGKKDWLGLGKRSRKSPAAATHPTGAWRVRENQIAGKVEIDKNTNAVLQDLSNRQGVEENLYYELFVEILLQGLKEFERYRQDIIRSINVKNGLPPKKESSISDKIASNPSLVSTLTSEESQKLAGEIKEYQKAHKEARKERDEVELRYKYDVRILNVLATVGLKASSIAHEMRNDRNAITDNVDNIISALKDFDIWDELLSPEHTEKAYQNIPYLLETNKNISSKILVFMNTMLTEIEKKQFAPSLQSIDYLLRKIKDIWEEDYAWVTINIQADTDICYIISEDILQVVFDNLILNSIQQNENANHLNIAISVRLSGDLLFFSYSDNGKGLDKKYLQHPEKILEVHETNRKKGHGLGMWIVNNTINMSGGEIAKITGGNGFAIEFTIGGSK